MQYPWLSANVLARSAVRTSTDDGKVSEQKGIGAGLTRRTSKSAATKRIAKKAHPARETEASPKEFDSLIGYRLRRAYNVQVQRFASVGRVFNIRPVQFAILKLAYHNPQLNQTEISKALHKKRENIVTLLDDLEGRGLVARVQDPKDKRFRVLHLTPAGKRVTEKMLDRHARLTRNLEAAFGARRLDRFSELLDAFCNLDPEPDLD